MEYEEIEQQEHILNEEEKKISTVWIEILGHSNFTKNDNFFDVGGHSLLSTKLIFSLRKLYDCEFPLDILLKNPTISSLALGTLTVCIFLLKLFKLFNLLFLIQIIL